MKIESNNYKRVEKFNLADTPKGSIAFYWLKIVSDGMNKPIEIPLMVARGKTDHPILGLTAAIHGNELNGIPVIQRLFDDIDVKELNGTIVAIPVVNEPAFTLKQRRFKSGVDLNHIMPGKKNGKTADIYAYRVFNKVIKYFDYLIDLHTASFGRINSYYIRADMKDKSAKEMALLQNAQIIVHNPSMDGTLRGAAENIGIPAITLEVGNPGTFQKKYIRSGLSGIHNVLCHLNMVNDCFIEDKTNTVICKSSHWIYTDVGGLLTVEVELMDILKKGDRIATIRNIFGEVLKHYYAPSKGIVIGKSTHPVNLTGGRILHLGIIK